MCKAKLRRKGNAQLEEALDNGAHIAACCLRHEGGRRISNGAGGKRTVIEAAKSMLKRAKKMDKQVGPKH